MSLLELHVRLSGSSTTVFVDPYDSVSSILSHFALDRAIILFQDQVIHPAFSFSFHSIPSGAEIVVLERPSLAEFSVRRKPFVQLFPSLGRIRERSRELSQLFGCGSDAECFQRAAEELADPAVASETARLRDGSFDRIEGSAVLHRRLMMRFVALNERSEPVKVEGSRCSTQPPTSPSCEELPCVWGRRKKTNE
jgi:hypothetical protein